MQCKACKQIKCVEEFLSKDTKRIYKKACRTCLDAGKKHRLKGKE